MCCLNAHVRALLSADDHKPPLTVTPPSTTSAPQDLDFFELEYAAIAGGDCSILAMCLTRYFRQCIINPCSKSVRQGLTLTTPQLTMPTATTTSTECLNCAAAKESGKRSCCARGGSWFKNCGDAGDTKVDHTWAEGIQACKSGTCTD